MTSIDPAAPPVAAVALDGRPRGHVRGHPRRRDQPLCAGDHAASAGRRWEVARLPESSAPGKPPLTGLALIAARMPENGGSESLDYKVREMLRDHFTRPPRMAAQQRQPESAHAAGLTG